MTCRASVGGRWRWWWVGGGALGVVAAVLLGACGCMSPQLTSRPQCAEEGEQEVPYHVKTVGDVTDVGNVQALQVGGVGLVTDLEGTGGHPQPSPYTGMIEEQLQKSGVRNTKAVLSDPNNSLVLVSALIPAGAHKGDPIDVEVTLPPGSKTTSLRGGVLRESTLYTFALARTLSPKFADSNQALRGEIGARAGGPLVVGMGAGDEPTRVRQGVIWGGARCVKDRPLYLLLTNGHQEAKVASAVADRINATFPGSLGAETATAKNKTLVQLNVPPQYRHNVPRYLRVVRLIPLEGTAGGHPAAPGTAAAAGRRPYREALAEDLLNPARAVTAALRLEALGESSVPALKVGLENKQALVRFCAAEALVYLGSPTGAPELAVLLEQHPTLRAYCLTALASLDEAVCQVKLQELLSSSDPETRYGAFRALRALNEHDPLVEGKLLNRSFWLHRVAPDSPSLVHVTGSRRAEIVLFGEEPRLLPPFEFLAGDDTTYTITAGRDDEHCIITRFSARQGTRDTRTCSLGLEDVLRTLASLGGTYPEAVELLHQASSCRCLTCQVAVDQLPRAVSVQALAKAGQDHPDLQQTDADILDARPDLGELPNLFARDAERGPQAAPAEDEDDGALLREHKPDESKSAERHGRGVE